MVITGGATLLPGLPELAEEVLGLPARRGAPRGIGGLVDVVRSPEYSTGVGLVLYGARGAEMIPRETAPVRDGSVLRRMRSWIGEMF